MAGASRAASFSACDSGQGCTARGRLGTSERRRSLPCRPWAGTGRREGPRRERRTSQGSETPSRPGVGAEGGTSGYTFFQDVFLLTVNRRHGLCRCACGDSRPGSSAQMRKITIVVMTGLDFAANVWAAHSLRKEERLRALKENRLAGGPFSGLRGRARGTGRVQACVHARACTPHPTAAAAA